MDELKVFDTEHWLISHRRDARYPGYLMVSSKEQAAEVSEISEAALSTLGLVLRDTERLLTKAYAPCKVVFYKLGFSRGFAVHFHVAPVTEQLVRKIQEHPAYSNEPDGNDAILFLSREYCERPLTEQELEVQAEIVTWLRSLCH